MIHSVLNVHRLLFVATAIKHTASALICSGASRPWPVRQFSRRSSEMGDKAAGSSTASTPSITHSHNGLGLAEAPAAAGFYRGKRRAACGACGPSSRHAQWLALRGSSLRFGLTGGTF
jgi:hypothetical protein